MKNRDVSNFWIGFVLSLVLVVWLIWLWQKQREISPPPLVIRRRRSPREPEVAGTATAPVPDPLEKIRGIGPVTATRLNEAGITTFDQLAKLDPVTLGDIVRVPGWDPADWIEEARRLAEDG